jgi:hypothetical protein
MIDERPFTYLLLLINLILSIRFYTKSKCEVPLFISVFNIFVEYRIISLKLGLANWVRFDYGINFKFNFDLAYTVSNLILTGATIMIYCFMAFYKPNKNKIDDSNKYLKQFTNSKKNYIIAGLVFFSFLQIALRNSNAGGYGFLTRLGNTSFIILLFLVFISTDTKKLITKLIYLGIFTILAYLTFSAELRFQFLGWMIPIGYYFVRDIKPSVKLVYMISGIFFVMIIFSLIRALQYQSKDVKQLSNSELFSIGLQRMIIADDVNFIDGFIMLYQVYPRYLDYDYGFEHIEVFIRPIPRAWWPDKPVGSWVRNYQKKYTGKVLESAGFSPTIWGVFYSELGVYGVVIFSVLWAWFLTYLYGALGIFRSDLSYILIGTLLVSLIPIFRSGDMAGDFAIVLMSFWPLIIFVKQYKKFVKRQLLLEAYNEFIK